MGAVEFELREFGGEGQVGVGGEGLQGAGEEGAGAVGGGEGGGEEGGVVEPEGGGLGESFESGLEEGVGFLGWGLVGVIARVCGERSLHCCCRIGCGCLLNVRGFLGHRCTGRHVGRLLRENRLCRRRFRG